MTTKGLLVRLEARSGKESDVEAFLRTAEGLVRDEPATTAWFAVRFGRAEYGIFDAFADEEGRAAHLDGAVATALMQRADELFARAPEIHKLDVLADKLPDGPVRETVSKAPRELAKNGLKLLGGVPDMDFNRVLATKLPAQPALQGVR